MGSLMTVVITDKQIRMPENTIYDYTIDTVDQTISFSVGDVAGQADYKLGTDSNTGIVTLTLTESLDGSQKETKFVKLSDNTSATPSKTGGQSVFATTDSGTGQ